MEIDPEAPILVEEEITIHAPRERVFAILTDFKEWPAWSQTISDVQFDGHLVVSNRFAWKIRGSVQISQIEEIIAPERIVWKNSTTGNIQRIYVWVLEETTEGTSVIARTSARGWLAKLFRKHVQKSITTSLKQRLTELKYASENAVPAPTPATESVSSIEEN